MNAMKLAVLTNIGVEENPNGLVNAATTVIATTSIPRKDSGGTARSRESIRRCKFDCRMLLAIKRGTIVRIIPK